MYEIFRDGISLGQFEDPVFIKLAENGCYNECNKDMAEGICVKLPTEYTIENEDGIAENIQTLEDTVFRLREDGLKGFEPICSISLV